MCAGIEWDPQMRKGVSPDEVLKTARFCVGTPDDCIATIERYERMGADRDHADLPGRTGHQCRGDELAAPLREIRHSALPRQGQWGKDGRGSPDTVFGLLRRVVTPT